MKAILIIMGVLLVIVAITNTTTPVAPATTPTATKQDCRAAWTDVGERMVYSNQDDYTIGRIIDSLKRVCP